jgi:hypothetical protein
MSKRYRKPTLAELFKRMQGAEIELGIQMQKFEVRKPAYQPDFIPNYVTTAQDYYKRTKAEYEAAVAEYDASREDNHR